MKAFVRESSTALVLPGVNCDTDQIIPGRFLKADRAGGYGQYLMHDIRRDSGGHLLPEFPLNRPGADAARFLVVGDNFGCGSSREGAVYALADHGIRALVAPGFGDIFQANALKNGVLPIRVQDDLWRRLCDALQAAPELQITIDLEADRMELPAGLGVHPLGIPAFARDCILRGVDEIGLTRGHLPQIEAFEAAHLARNPWILREGGADG